MAKYLSKKKLKKIKRFFKSPPVMYVAGTLASALAAGAIKSLSEKYPNIAEVLKQGLADLDERIGATRNPS